MVIIGRRIMTEIGKRFLTSETNRINTKYNSRIEATRNAGGVGKLRRLQNQKLREEHMLNVMMGDDEFSIIVE